MSIEEAIEQFRRAAIEKGDFASPPKRDNALARKMHEARRALWNEGESGESAFRSLLMDESPHVRVWVATELIASGDQAARLVLEELAEQRGLLGFNAAVVLQEFDAGRLRPPFRNESGNPSD
jgi:hypothetical protein